MPDNTSATNSNHYEQVTKNTLGITKFWQKQVVFTELCK